MRVSSASTTHVVRGIGFAFVLVAGLTACSAQQQLVADPPAIEPAYPAYEPPNPDDSSAPVPSPSAIPSAAPSASPTATTVPTLRPTTAAPEPSPVVLDPAPTATAPAPVAPSPVVPVVPSAPATITPTAPATPAPTLPPAPVVLTTAPWSAQCNQGLTIPATSGQVSLAATGPRELASGELWLGDSTAVSNLTSTAAAERFFTSTIVLRDGVVVALSPGGTASGPQIALAAGEKLAVPAQHDLQGECGLATTSPDGRDEFTAADADTALNTAAIKPLPPGEYTLVVVLHLDRDGEQRLLAASAPVALTIT